MKPSALSLQELTFLNVQVDIDPEFKGTAKDYDFEGAQLHWGLRHGQGSSENTWWVGLTFGTRSTEVHRCPYIIHVRAVGLFSVDSDFPEEKREKFAFESGATMIYGAIREMVATITARSGFGTLMLPTASFFDTFEEHQRKLAEKSAKPTPRKRSKPPSK